MRQITVRGLSVDLPALDADTELDAVSSLSEPASLISGFEFSGARVPTLDLKDVTLVTGKIGKVRAGETSMIDTQVRSVEFTGCELGSLREAGFADCYLTGSLFSRCDLALASFGPGRYARCDLRDNDLAKVTGAHYLKKVILDRAQLMQLAEALAAELSVTFGDSLDDSASAPG